MNEDLTYMERALELAEEGRYSVSPNPMVGCVVVRDGRILGEGFHEHAGSDHAEVRALQNCEDGAKGATVYVNLEPCAHFGKTPPCADALVRAGISRVVAAVQDPFEEVGGRGFAKLREAGIQVESGVLRERASRLNEKFLFASARKRPFLLIKAGMTLDGKLSTSNRRKEWITSDESRRRSLALREEYDAIMVGSGTVIADNPELTRRLGWNASTPWLRVIVDAEGTIPRDARVLSDEGKTLLFTCRPTSYVTQRNVEIVALEASEGKLDLDLVLEELYARGVRSVIAEGGSMLHTELIRRTLWQKMTLFIAPIFIGGSAAPSIFSSEGITELAQGFRFAFDKVELCGEDLVVTAYPGPESPS